MSSHRLLRLYAFLHVPTTEPPQAPAPSLADELTPKTEPQGVVERQRLIELLAQLRSQSAELAQTLQVNGAPSRACRSLITHGAQRTNCSKTRRP